MYVGSSPTTLFMENVTRDALAERRQLLAEALANPSDENIYVASDDPSNRSRIKIAEKYIEITEYMMEMDEPAPIEL